MPKTYSLPIRSDMKGVIWRVGEALKVATLNATVIS